MVLTKANMTILVGVLLLASTCAAFEWKECSGQHSDVQSVTDVKLNPEPVPAGSTANFTITGKSKIAVEEGQMKLSVYYMGLPVYHKTLDLPDPIPEGEFTSSFKEDFPIITPPGNYKVVIQSSTEDDDPLLCLEVHFRVTWPVLYPLGAHATT